MIIHRKDASHSRLIRQCDACMSAKMGRTAFSSEMKHQVEGPNDKIVADLCGPITTLSIGEKGETLKRKQYISLITDVFSRHVACLIVDKKREASDHYTIMQQRYPLVEI